MPGRHILIPPLRTSWRLYAISLALSYLLVRVVEPIVVTRGFEQFQQQTTHISTTLEIGRQKAMVLGSIITIGAFNPVVKATAKGLLAPANPEVSYLLSQLDHKFGLSNVFVMNSEGVIVAYQIESGISAVGRKLAYRTYFRTAMEGIPNMYAALGTHTGERGFYIAAPILEKGFAAALPTQTSIMTAPPATLMLATRDIVGVFVAKLSFEEVDNQLAKESSPYAVVSPEGVVFASNVTHWQFQVLGSEKNLELAMHNKRTAKAYEKHPPRLLTLDEQGRLTQDGQNFKTVSANLDWKDPNGAWRLVGFADPSISFGLPERFAIGSLGFLFFVLLGSLLKAQRNVAERTAELKVANRKLESLSNTDALTNLANRRHFDNTLSREWSRARREEHPLALMMIDVDEFKKYNDHYGHLAGDECLKRIAQTMLTCAKRPGDLIARYGGEEFSLILSNTDITTAQRLAETICCTIEALNIPHAPSSTGMVTVSIGVTVMTTDKIQPAELLLKSADDALYQAKKTGRNRVVMDLK